MKHNKFRDVRNNKIEYKQQQEEVNNNNQQEEEVNNNQQEEELNNNNQLQEEVNNNQQKKQEIIIKTNNNQEEIYNQNDIDDIFINLKIISKIEIGDKIMENEKYINIDKSYLQFILRWYFEINRINNLNFINKIYKQSFDLYDYFQKNDMELLLLRLNTELKYSIGGLINYKQTYINDKLFQSEIDVLIENIRSKIN